MAPAGPGTATAAIVTIFLAALGGGSWGGSWGHMSGLAPRTLPVEAEAAPLVLPSEPLPEEAPALVVIDQATAQMAELVTEQEVPVQVMPEATTLETHTAPPQEDAPEFKGMEWALEMPEPTQDVHEDESTEPAIEKPTPVQDAREFENMETVVVKVEAAQATPSSSSEVAHKFKRVTHEFEAMATALEKPELAQVLGAAAPLASHPGLSEAAADGRSSEIGGGAHRRWASLLALGAVVDLALAVGVGRFLLRRWRWREESCIGPCSEGSGHCENSETWKEAVITSSRPLAQEEDSAQATAACPGGGPRQVMPTKPMAFPWPAPPSLPRPCAEVVRVPREEEGSAVAQQTPQASNAPKFADLSEDALMLDKATAWAPQVVELTELAQENEILKGAAMALIVEAPRSIESSADVMTVEQLVAEAAELTSEAPHAVELTEADAELIVETPDSVELTADVPTVEEVAAEMTWEASQAVEFTADVLTVEDVAVELSSAAQRAVELTVDVLAMQEVAPELTAELIAEAPQSVELTAEVKTVEGVAVELTSEVSQHVDLTSGVVLTSVATESTSEAPPAVEPTEGDAILEEAAVELNEADMCIPTLEEDFLTRLSKVADASPSRKESSSVAGSPSPRASPMMPLEHCTTCMYEVGSQVASTCSPGPRTSPWTPQQELLELSTPGEWPQRQPLEESPLPVGTQRSSRRLFVVAKEEGTDVAQHLGAGIDMDADAAPNEEEQHEEVQYDEMEEEEVEEDPPLLQEGEAPPTTWASVDAFPFVQEAPEQRQFVGVQLATLSENADVDAVVAPIVPSIDSILLRLDLEEKQDQSSSREAELFHELEVVSTQQCPIDCDSVHQMSVARQKRALRSLQKISSEESQDDCKMDSWMAKQLFDDDAMDKLEDVSPMRQLIQTTDEEDEVNQTAALVTKLAPSVAAATDKEVLAATTPLRRRGGGRFSESSSPA